MLAIRPKLEDNEARALAPFALRSRDSGGRLHSEPEPRYRTAFQRDRDRIIHSAAFRSLEYKTQVFSNDAGDYFRTRLTHTLEVAQIGRALARAMGVNEDLVEAICLAHDLGHPPFGHTGEAVLDDLLRDHGGFNHNHQSYRVVTKLERRYPRWQGLNLTRETLDGIAKHETSYDQPALTDLSSKRGPSLEAQIANIADELAYNAHDLDDGLQAGIISAAQVAALGIWQKAATGVGWRGDTLDEVSRHHVIRELVGLQVDDALAVSLRQIAERQPKSPGDVQQLERPLVRHSPRQRQLNAELKNFLYHQLYRDAEILRMQDQAEIALRHVFAACMAAAADLPAAYADRLDKEPTERVVADYVASLTDRSAMQAYQRNLRSS